MPPNSAPSIQNPFVTLLYLLAYAFQYRYNLYIDAAQAAADTVVLWQPAGNRLMPDIMRRLGSARRPQTSASASTAG
jgi:hypothetical protein